MYAQYRPDRPWDLSDITPDTAANRAALRELFQARLQEESDSNAEHDSQA
jgi:hypothetical protein